jgi:DNA-binding response OmpR family regulator
MTTKKQTVLVADDDPRLLKLIQRNLELANYRVVTVSDGPSVLRHAEEEEPDLYVLDIMMPGLDGREVTRRLREFSIAPVLMLTAKDTEDDKVAGLEAGADDYLTKPFGIREFIARVRALLRRRPSRAPGHAAAVVAGRLTVDPARRHARLQDREIELTAHEFDLLYLLATNRGIVFSRDALMQKVWGDDTHITERSVDTLVKRVRRKIEQDPADPKFVLTVWGTGYKFADV